MSDRDPKSLIIETLQMLMARRDESPGEVTPSTHLYDDLDLASLEAAELSSILEDELGRDPYSDGELPETVADIIAFYDE